MDIFINAIAFIAVVAILTVATEGPVVKLSTRSPACNGLTLLHPFKFDRFALRRPRDSEPRMDANKRGFYRRKRRKRRVGREGPRPRYWPWGVVAGTGEL